MPSFARIVRAASRAFGYDAVESSGRRRAPKTKTLDEDRQLTARKRRILSATTRDAARNFAIAAWAIRKHLDYVSTFKFQAKTPDRPFNAALELVLEDLGKPHNFELTRRHPLRRAVRLTEACRVKDGDVLWVKFAPAAGLNRGKVQVIEGDRIVDPPNLNRREREEWRNGLRLSPAGITRDYGISYRDQSGTGFTRHRQIPAGNAFLHAFYDRFDQGRGISPVAAALNWFQDTYEGFEYGLAKAKVAQLFGLKITRDGDTPFHGPGTATPTVDANSDGVEDSGYEVDLGKGPFQLDLNPGDDAEFLESKTPSAETVDFLKLMVAVALKSLDIPFSFFDESFTNFYGSRGGLIQYQKSCRTKIADIQELLNAWTAWRLGLMVADGSLQLPPGQLFDFLTWEWVPDGVPWWDPTKEVRGSAMAVAAAFDNPQRVCREVGTDVFENIDKTAEVLDYAREKGVPITFADATAFQPEITTATED